MSLSSLPELTKSRRLTGFPQGCMAWTASARMAVKACAVSAPALAGGSPTPQLALLCGARLAFVAKASAGAVRSRLLGGTAAQKPRPADESGPAGEVGLSNGYMLHQLAALSCFRWHSVLLPPSCEACMSAASLLRSALEGPET